jgi:hypothetical protein
VPELLKVTFAETVRNPELPISNVVPLGIDKLVVKLTVAEIVHVLELFVHVPPKLLHEFIARTTGFGGGLAAIAAGTAARSRTLSPAAAMSAPRAYLRDGPRVACVMTLSLLGPVDAGDARKPGELDQLWRPTRNQGRRAASSVRERTPSFS